MKNEHSTMSRRATAYFPRRKDVTSAKFPAKDSCVQFHGISSRRESLSDYTEEARPSIPCSSALQVPDEIVFDHPVNPLPNNT